MSNAGMTLKPKTLGRCPSCDRCFRKRRARETYCSIHCAVWPRITKAAPDACWPWQGQLVGGYGAGGFDKKRYRVSRVVLAEKLGRELELGEQALHSCDNPACCNPAHIFVGSAADNMADKVAKGRGSSIPPCLKGEAHGRAKLTEANVRDIWARRAEGSTKLGCEYGVANTTVHNIFRKTNWRWLTDTLK